MKITRNFFSRHCGKSVYEYRLKNDNGMKVSVLTYGAVLRKVLVPDSNGKFENVVIGLYGVNDYILMSSYIGAVVGRTAGRTSGGKFKLNGKEYQLSLNDGGNALHGNGEFSDAVWTAEKEVTDDEAKVKLTYVSPAGSNGYPGEVTTTVTYTLRNDNSITIFYNATTTEDTILNLTNHSYFNLSGNYKTDVREHILTTNADSYLPIKPDLTPTGEVAKVKGTLFDFSNGRALKEGMDSYGEQHLLAAKGYDHALLFTSDMFENSASAKSSANTAILEDKQSGRIMEMTTDYPCFVLYSGNQLNGRLNLFEKPLAKHMGVCLEAQLPPDSENNPQFNGKLQLDNLQSVDNSKPMTSILRKGETYSHYVTYKFGVK